MSFKTKFSPEEKLSMVLGLVSSKKTPTQVCQSFNIAPSYLHKLRRLFFEKAHLVFLSPKSCGQTREKELENEIDWLRQVVGKQAVQIELLKKGLLRI